MNVTVTDATNTVEVVGPQQVVVTAAAAQVVVEDAGAQGPTGPAGPTGATGPAGPGVAIGGTEGQVLVKDSATDYDTSWSSVTVQALRKAAAMPADGTTNRTSSTAYGWPLGQAIGGSTRALQANRLYIETALFLSRVTLDRIRLSVTTQAASAGQLCRLGVYETDDNMKPTVLKADLGTVDISSTGIKAITGCNTVLDEGCWAFVYVLEETCTLVYRNFTPPTSLSAALSATNMAAMQDRHYAPLTFGNLPATFPSGITWEGDLGATLRYTLQLGWGLA